MESKYLKVAVFDYLVVLVLSILLFFVIGNISKNLIKLDIYSSVTDHALIDVKRSFFGVIISSLLLFLSLLVLDLAKKFILLSRSVEKNLFIFFASSNFLLFLSVIYYHYRTISADFWLNNSFFFGFSLLAFLPAILLVLTISINCNLLLFIVWNKHQSLFKEKTHLIQELFEYFTFYFFILTLNYFIVRPQILLINISSFLLLVVFFFKTNLKKFIKTF